MAEYSENTKGLSDDEKKIVGTYRDSLAISKEFVRPYFDKWVRFYKLFAGILPPEIECTYSKVMLWFPYSVIDTEMPISMRSLLSANWFDLEAKELRYEPHVQTARKWAQYQLEKVQKINRTIVPTMQNALIFGTGYRWYSHKYTSRTYKDLMPAGEFMGIPLPPVEQDVTEERGVISGQYCSAFNVFPSPTGGMVNMADDTDEGTCDYVIVQSMMTRKQIEAEVEKGNFNKQQAGELLKSKADREKDPSYEFRDEILSAGTGWNQFQAPAWVQKMRDKQTMDNFSRYRVAWMFGRDKWCAIGEDRFLLYEGAPLLNRIPLAKFTPGYDLDNWFGIGLIEPAEDLILSMILNFNHRLDYLAGVFHPPTYVPKALVDELGGDLGAFDPEPYKTLPYAHKQYPGGVGEYIFHDRSPEINQQTFIEDGKMTGYLQEILGQDKIDRLQSETATVGASLISKSAARSMLRAINMDETGFADCIDLTLRFGDKYENENEIIRTGADGMPWEEIDHNAITDAYGITVTAAREMDMAEESFKKMLSIAPLFLNDPTIAGRVELQRQLLEKSKVFKNVDAILYGSGEMSPMGGMQGAVMPGGVPSLQNEMSSTMNRSTRQANTGRQVAAGNVMV